VEALYTLFPPAPDFDYKNSIILDEVKPGLVSTFYRVSGSLPGLKTT
jgi:hypothetical protein